METADALHSLEAGAYTPSLFSSTSAVFGYTFPCPPV